MTERVLPDGTVVGQLGNFVGIDQPAAAAAQASPHGNPKGQASAVVPLPPTPPKARIVL